MWLFSIQHIEPVAGVLILLSPQLNSPLSLCFSVLKAFLSHFPRHYPSETQWDWVLSSKSIPIITTDFVSATRPVQLSQHQGLGLFDVWMFLKNILVSDCYKKYIHHAPISNIYIQRERERNLPSPVSCSIFLVWLTEQSEGAQQSPVLSVRFNWHSGLIRWFSDCGTWRDGKYHRITSWLT